MGAVSSITFAMKTNQAVITDDQRARRLATESSHARTQITPHLLTWLLFWSWLGDSDAEAVISENTAMSLPLAKHFARVYHMALE